MPDQPSLPVVRPLPDRFSLLEAFARLSVRPGCLWLDSASHGPVESWCGTSQRPAESSIGEIGRYSFLTSDPVDTLTASVDHCDPWPQLDDWCRELPSSHDPRLPPFQGGIAGLIAYEAASWLEPVGLARENDLPTPAMSLGLYDWTIAVDHLTGKSWLISQGLGAQDPRKRLAIATERADKIQSWLAAPIRAPDHSKETNAPTVTSNFTSDQFRDCVAEIVRRIHDGDSFQVNLAQRLLCKTNLPTSQLYQRLRDCNPAPFGAYYAGDGFAVLSSSPEGFLKVRDGQVETRPIKGTVPRTGDPERDDRLASQLFRSEKDRAENIMIVDLMRNDLSRVCEDDSVSVTQLCQVERYQYVQHLVSVVQGKLAADKNVADLLAACFPGGSVTGAPKIEAMRTIARLEPNHRGPYCGSLGYISCGGSADFNILIRTITAAHGHLQIPVGGGITAKSDPAAEEAETWAKAKGMLQALSHGSEHPQPAPSQSGRTC